MMWIGSVNQYAKHLSLQNQWRQRQQSGNFTGAKKQDHVNFIRASDLLPDDERDDKLTAIMNKFQAGEKLSPDEWDYLRTKHPELYQKIRDAEREAEAYEESLRRCKTKDEAQRLHVSKLGDILTAAKNGDNGAMVRLNRLTKTMTAFTSSKEYHDLPTEAEEAVERESERQERVDALREEAEAKAAEREERSEALREDAQEDAGAPAVDADADHDVDVKADAGTTDGTERRPNAAGTPDIRHAVSRPNKPHTQAAPETTPAVPHGAGTAAARTGKPSGGTAAEARPAPGVLTGQRAYRNQQSDPARARTRRKPFHAEA